jgi:hypothetical protein
VTLESEVFTGVSAGARVDARRTCQEPRLTDHARHHGSDLAFDLSIIASLDGSRSQPPVPAAENPATRDAEALLETDRTFNVHCGRYLTLVCAGPGGIDRPTCE